MARQVKRKSVTFRCTEEELKVYQQAADILDVSISYYARMRLKERADSDIAAKLDLGLQINGIEDPA